MSHAGEDIGGNELIRVGFLLVLIFLAPLSGCLSMHNITDECVIQNASDDGTLTIVTYDILAIGEDVLTDFTEQRATR